LYANKLFDNIQLQEGSCRRAAAVDQIRQMLRPGCPLREGVILKHEASRWQNVSNGGERK
jgi:hypothetical protein